MNKKVLNAAIAKLADDFDAIEWDRRKVGNSLVQMWPGRSDEEIMICVFRGSDIHEPFHRQDFFFLNYAYKGDYGAISEKYDNHITVKENSCYIGRPNADYAIYGHNNEEVIIIGVLIQKESFLKNYFSILAADSGMFRFFLTQDIGSFEDEYLQLDFDRDSMIRNLLEWMVIKYAEKKEETQQILRPMTVSLLLEIAGQRRKSRKEVLSDRISDQFVRYIEDHFDHVTLADIAAHFSYHPNYVSTVLTKETGKSFSAHVLEQRMARARILLQNTTLSVADIAEMLGYSNTSNFHKAYKEYYGTTPRES